MKSGMIIGVVLLCVCMPLAGQETAHADSEKVKILALENAWNQAETSKDAKALDALLASTLVYVDADGKLMDKAKFLASVKNSPVQSLHVVNEFMTVFMYGNSAVVTGTYRESGVENGKRYSQRGRFTDTWIKQGGAWVCAASQSTLISH
jgi:ketosteroid isomerase-like protein